MSNSNDPRAICGICQVTQFCVLILYQLGLTPSVGMLVHAKFCKKSKKTEKKRLSGKSLYHILPGGTGPVPIGTSPVLKCIWQYKPCAARYRCSTRCMARFTMLYVSVACQTDEHHMY